MEQLNSNGFGGKTLGELKTLFEENRKPGRRSKEQQHLAEIIEFMETNNMQRMPNGVVVRGPQKPSERFDIEEDEDDRPVEAPKKGKPAAKAKPTSAVVEKIQVPAIHTGLITINVVGTEPLLMHAWDVKSKRQIEEKQQGRAHRTKVARDPNAEYEAARYVDAQNRECIPARCFKNAMVEAATFIPDLTKKQIKGSIYVKGDLLPILHKDTKKPMKSIKRDDMVRIGGMSKVADVRYRPQYNNWAVEVSIEFDTSIFTTEQVVNLLNRAGFNVGVGEWRPTFGRFAVVQESQARGRGRS